MPDDAPRKVFGVGLNKTGTTTLGECGRILGLRGTTYSKPLLRDVVRHGRYDRLDAVVARFDLFEDLPWPLVYRHVDERFPDSRFVLTVRRSAEVWYDSLLSHSMRTHPFKQGRGLTYGHSYPHRHRRHFLDYYERHNDAVRWYFRDRPDALLEICWERGDGFAQLSPFLDLPDPGVPVPHANKGADRGRKRSRVVVNHVLRALDR